jgi:hypothetical protein
MIMESCDGYGVHKSPGSWCGSKPLLLIASAAPGAIA